LAAASEDTTTCPPVPLDETGSEVPPAPPRSRPPESTAAAFEDTATCPPVPLDEGETVVPPVPPRPPASIPVTAHTHSPNVPAEVQVWDPSWPVGHGHPTVSPGTHLAPSLPPPQPPRSAKQRKDAGTKNLVVMPMMVAPFGLWRNLRTPMCTLRPTNFDSGHPFDRGQLFSSNGSHQGPSGVDFDEIVVFPVQPASVDFPLSRRRYSPDL
jgi:hypothetical protein